MLWPAELYDGFVPGGEAAAKLASSAVAPAVASARGYRGFDEASLGTILELVAVTGAERTGRMLRRAVSGGADALYVPYYVPEDIVASQTSSWPAAQRTWQVRPRADKRRAIGGKHVKYESPPGAPSVIGAHPSTPAAWFSGASAVWVAEGAIKADALLSAWLVSAGVSPQVLAGQMTRQDLCALMEALGPPVLFLSIAGVGNWHNKAEWTWLPLRDKAVHLALDGDVASNLAVWRQASSFVSWAESKQARVDVLSLPDGPLGRTGPDDWLAEHSYTELNAHLGGLPAKPTVEVATGPWRFDETTCTAFHMVSSATGATWEPAVPMIGRVRQVTSHASLDDANDGIAAVTNVDVQVEISYLGPELGRCDAVVGGPDRVIFGEPPERWQRAGAKVPPDLARQPAWPPSKEWFAAAKAHRFAECKDVVSVEHMGWVPGPAGPPVYVVGRQVISAGTDSEVPTLGGLCPGVDDSVLTGASRFGVSLPHDAEAARDALARVVEVYRSTWADPRIWVLVLAIGLRPVVPLAPRVPVLLVGPPGSGKTWTASAMMSFWQASPGAWAPRRLPGSATDTPYASEAAVARSPIWVLDDLAPAADQVRAKGAEDTVSGVIRAVANGAARRRMNADGTSRVTWAPRAQLIVTAENAPSVMSVLDRSIYIDVRAGFLSDVGTEPVNRLRDLENLQAVVTGAALAHYSTLAAKDGWAHLRRYWEMHSQLLYLGSSTEYQGQRQATRHREIFADVCLGLMVACDLARSLGMDDLADELFARKADLVSLVADCYHSQAASQPGLMLIEALTSVLASGIAHVAPPGRGGAPFDEGPDTVLLNQALGWRPPAGANDNWAPLGRRIGWLVRSEDNAPVVLFDPDASFAEAQRAFPSKLPAGTRSATAWRSAWDLGLVGVDGWERRKRSKDEVTTTVRRRFGDTRLAGVPVPLSAVVLAPYEMANTAYLGSTAEVSS